MAWWRKVDPHPRVIVSDAGFYTSIRAQKQPTPGAMEYGFATEYLALHPYIGPGIGFAQQMRNFAPQNTQNAGVAVVTGLGGLAQGQIVGQPLSDPYNGA